MRQLPSGFSFLPRPEGWGGLGYGWIKVLGWVGGETYPRLASIHDMLALWRQLGVPVGCAPPNTSELSSSDPRPACYSMCTLKPIAFVILMFKCVYLYELVKLEKMG